MRFQKRLQAAIHGTPEAPHALDYKLLKKALRDAGDTAAFTAHLEAQLQKVDEYYVAAEAALEATMAAATARAPAGPPPRALLTQVRRDAASLQRFAALNYVAVVKATKKAAKKGAAAPTALAALAPRAFFASPRLASLLTAVDVALAEDDLATCDLGTTDARRRGRSASPPPPAAGELGCPVCIGRLRQPVVLTCGHRFCWGCATGAAGAAVARGAAAAKKGGSADGAAVALEATTFWPCPTCRKPQAWYDGPVLEVDANLERLLATLAPASEPGSPPPETEPAPPPPAGLLPPKQAGAPSLTVVLDLDGTLISSYPPSRAGALLGGRDGGTAYIVGVGSALNPDGVLVVERPGLGPFLRGLAHVAEVAVYTAGLQDYAEPIIDELEKRYGVPTRAMRLYRPATESTPAYPCVKNLGALGRPLARTLLVDDTPLAFLAHPSNGVPVVPWRGDGGGADTVLTGALLPLLQELAAIDGDIRPVLESKFLMGAWFKSQALECGESVLATKPAAATVDPAVAVAPATAPDTESDDDPTAPPLRPLAVFDFDHTLLDADIGLEIVTTLTPELAPQIQTLAMPQSFVAATNAVLREAARRGVSRDAVLATARRVGLGLHGGGAAALRAAAAAADVAILSDANHVFITSALAAAGLAGAVGTVVTNGAAFKPTPRGAGGAAHHLVVEPRHAAGRHACPHCPANLCKGLELGLLRRSKTRQRVLYSGDGANDLCPALALTRGDAVLVRRGHGLERLLRGRGAAAPPRADTPPRSPVLAAAADAGLAAALAPGVAAYAWTTRDELAALVAALLES